VSRASHHDRGRAIAEQADRHEVPDARLALECQ